MYNVEVRYTGPLTVASGPPKIRPEKPEPSVNAAEQLSKLIDWSCQTSVPVGLMVPLALSATVTDSIPLSSGIGRPCPYVLESARARDTVMMPDQNSTFLLATAVLLVA